MLTSGTTDQEIEQLILNFLLTRTERKVALVIAKVAEAAGNSEEQFLFRVEAAIKRLTAMQALEARGDISIWRHGEIRLIA